MNGEQGPGTGFASYPQERRGAIRTNVAKLRKAGLPDSEIRDYLKAEGLSGDPAEVAVPGAQRPGDLARASVERGRASMSLPDLGKPMTAGETATGVLGQLLQGITAGTSDELAPVTGGNTEEVRALNRRMRFQHPFISAGAETVGGIVPAAASLAVAPVRLTQALAEAGGGWLSRALQSGARAIPWGAAYGAGHAEGGPRERLEGAVHGAEGAAAVGAAGSVVAPAVRSVAGRVFAPERSARASALRSIATEGEGYTAASPRLEGEPRPLALDQAPGAVMSRVEGAVTRPGQAREQVKSVLESRLRGIRPGVARSLERETGVGPGVAPATQIARATSEKFNVGDELFGQAREATQNKPVQSQALDEVMATPTGREAWRTVRRIRADNPQAPLPKVPSPNDPETLVTVPDAQAVHEMKRLLFQWAGRGETPSGAPAMTAQQAKALWGKVLPELGPEFGAADAAYTKAAEVERMATKGAQVPRVPSNPSTASPRRAVRGSLTGLREEVEQASPEGQEAARRGAAGAFQTAWREAKAPTSAPTGPSPMGTFYRGAPGQESPAAKERLAFAFETPEQMERFGQSAQKWERARSQHGELFGGSPTARRTASEQQGGSAGKTISLAFRGRLADAFRTLAGAGTEDEELAKMMMQSDFGPVMNDALKRILLDAQRRRQGSVLAGALGGQPWVQK